MVKERVTTPKDRINKQADRLVFKKIGHEDMPVIWEFLKREQGRTTDFSYGGLLMWVDLFSYEYAVYRDTLFIKGVVENNLTQPAFSLPVGTLPLAESLAILKQFCDEAGIPLELSAVPEYAMEELRRFNPLFEEEMTDWGDYLYDADMLSTLSGKKMSKKRNHVNCFIAHNPEWSFKPLTVDNIREVEEFMKIYDRELDDSPMGREESLLAKKVLRMLEDGDPVMRGGILYSAPGEICAYSVGDVKGDTLYVHIEKATRSVNGSYEMINHEFASYMKSLYPEIKYINREDDGGDEGLRKAKESYHPLELLRKYNIILGM